MTQRALSLTDEVIVIVFILGGHLLHRRWTRRGRGRLARGATEDPVSRPATVGRIRGGCRQGGEMGGSEGVRRRPRGERHA